MGLLLWSIVTKQQPREPEVTSSHFLQAVDEGRVATVTIQGQNIRGVYKADRDGKGFKTFAPEDPDLVRMLRDKGVEIEARPEEAEPWYLVALVQWAPMLLLIGVWVFFMRQMQVGGGKAMSFGKSRAKLLSENTHKVTFNDVAGIDEAKEELEEIIAFPKDPKKFTKLGGRIPKGVLLVGPPGPGKTLLARAVAGDAGVPFFSISGAEFVEMFVGVGAARVRDLFEQARQHVTAIIFIDELDALGRARGAYVGGGHDEKEQTLNQLLAELDGFDPSSGLVLLGATNRPEILDPALLRAGRFDRQILVDRPDKRGREQILAVHLRKAKLAVDVNPEQIAALTPGFTGADLANLVNEATLLATRRNADSVTMADFTNAIERMVAGLEKRNRLLKIGR